MSVQPSDLFFYGSTNMPEADNLTVGGAVDFTKSVTFFDITPNGTLSTVSGSGIDTAVNFSYLVRDPTGATATVTGTLNGTVAASGTQTAERLLSAVVTGGAIGPLTNPGGTTAVGDVAIFASTLFISAHTAQAGSANGTLTTPPLFHLQLNDGTASTGMQLGYIIRIKSGTGVNQLRRVIATTGYGTDFVAVNRNWSVVPDNTSVYDVMQGMLFDLAPNQIKAITRIFATSAADIPGGSNRTFYEKIFVVNNNTATALTPVSGSAGVAVQVSSISPGFSGTGVVLSLAPDSGLNGTAIGANRQTLPVPAAGGSLTFVAQPSNNIFVPSPGNLPSGAAPNTAGALGIWVSLFLPNGVAPYKGAATLQVNGNTT